MTTATDAAPRRHGFCWALKPRCLAGHRLPLGDTVLFADGIVRCRHRDPLARDRQCGRLLYVAQLHMGWRERVGGQGDTVWLVAEITEAERRTLRETEAIFLERLALLGLTLPGVAVDLAAGTSDPDRPEAA